MSFTETKVEPNPTLTALIALHQTLAESLLELTKVAATPPPTLAVDPYKIHNFNPENNL